MIPHNIQQKLEDRSFDCYQEALFDMSRKAHDHIYFRGASDLYFLLTEGAESNCDYCKSYECVACGEHNFAKMMAMEAEIQRLRDEVGKRRLTR